MIVLDTHAWIWWTAAPARLSAKARAAVESAKEISVAAISCWELAMLVAHGRLSFDRDVLTWVRQALAARRIALAPLTPEIAIAAAVMPKGFHGDPADRLIVATAQTLKATLITKDQRIRRAKAVGTVW